MRITVRYNTPDSQGETRTQRNARFGQSAPTAEWPKACDHLIDLFFRLSQRRQSGEAGPQPICHREVEAALRRWNITLHPWEHRALDAMEQAFMSAMGGEIKADFDRRKSATSKPSQSG